MNKKTQIGLIVSLIALCVQLSRATETVIKTTAANGADLLDAANWSAGIPGVATVAVFTNTATRTFNLSGNATWLGIAKRSSTGNYSTAITNSYILTVGASGIDLSTAIGNFTINSPVALGAAQSWTVTNTRVLQVAGQISGGASATLAKEGAGVLRLTTSTNAFSGNTLVNGGVLSIAFTADLPGWNTAGKYSVASGASLVVNKQVTDSSVAAILATGNLAAGAGIGFDTTYGDRTNNFVLADTGAGALALAKINDFALVITNANTYSGGTTLYGGMLMLNNDNALGTGLLTMAGGSLSNTVDCALSNAVNLSSDGAVWVLGSRTLTLSGVITNSGALTKVGAGTLVLSGTNSYTGITSVEGGTLKLGANDAIPQNSLVDVKTGGTLDLNGFNQTLTNSGGLDLGNDPGTAEVKTGTGTLTLKQPTLARIDYSANRHPGSATISGKVVYDNVNFVLTAGDSTNTAEELIIDASISKKAGASQGTFYAETTAGGVIVLNGSNTLNNGTAEESIEVRSPTVVLGNNFALGSGSGSVNVGYNYGVSAGSDAALLVKSGVMLARGLLMIRHNGTEKRTLGTLSTNGVATYSGAIQLRQDTVLTAAAGGTVDFTGILSSTGGVTKIGAGVVRLTAANAYSGATFVSNGTLLVNGSLTNVSAVTVFSGAKLGGSGRVGGVTVKSGATLAPGDGVGLLTINGNLSCESGAVYSFEATSASSTDSVDVNGTLTLPAGGLTLDAAPAALAVLKSGTVLFTYDAYSGPASVPLAVPGDSQTYRLVNDVANSRILLKLPPSGTIVAVH